MSHVETLLAILSHDPLSPLYFAQSATYGLAFWAARYGRHAPWQIYLISCLIHFTLGLLHHWPAG
ncbi:MAG: hypothetical protein EXR07_13675 [Acetobacteraceae bacterium]|nr:hypothetical protein [Acetobacteraceae bacterium]